LFAALGCGMNLSSKKGIILFSKRVQVALFIIIPAVIINSQNVVLNELMTLNTKTIADEDGDYPDWIELYNSNTDPVNLGGMGLSDDNSQLHKWIFPQVILNPGEFLLVFASGKDKRTWIKHWETNIDKGDTWRYRPGTSEPPVTWRQIDFDDNSWTEGASGFGYGDGDDATILSQMMSVCIRHKFSISNADDVLSLLLHVDYDDAFVAYLNGIEVARSNIGIPGIIPPYDQGALVWREAEMYQGGNPQGFDVSAFIALLQTGDNVLAIQGHNYNLTSSDMSLIPFLTLGLGDIPENPRGLSELIGMLLPQLHTNFRLNADGEILYLSTPDSQITDSIYTGIIPSDISYGRQPDGDGSWFIFEQPTPGEPNSTTGYAGITDVPDFSLPAGIYFGEKTLSISHASNVADVYYTLDGAEPDENSPLYPGPLLLNETTILRARAHETGKMPSAIITATYLIDESIQLPVVSLSTDPQNLWDYESGIYVMGPNAEPDFPYHGANFWQDWEKPVHIEFFEKDGSPGFNVNAGVKITGGWSRGHPQKSLAIFIRRRYGQSELDYPLFPDMDITEFKAFVLRNGGNDWDGTLIRDGMMTGLTNPLGIDHQAYRPVVVFLNGEYWGIHNLREKVNEDFLASHHNVDPEEIDLLENNATPLEGSAEHYEMMMDYIVNNDVKNPGVYKNIQDLMNVNNYIDYEISQIYFANTDWPGNNIKFWRPQTTDGRWRWILYDTDFGFGLFNQNAVAHNTLEFATEPNGPSWPNPSWSTYLLRRLLENDDFKVQFINSIADYLNSHFSKTQVSNRITLLKGNIIIDIPRHLDRWGQQYTEWGRKVTALYAFAGQRAPYLRIFVVNKFQLSGTAEIMVRNANVIAGKVQINSLVVEDSLWTGTYFKDIPVQIKAIPESGYRFAGWSGGINSPHDSLSVILTGSLSLTAEFTSDTSMVINEINYNSSPDFPVGDWLEFYNNSRLPHISY
jgi:hypothetical protein